MIKPYRTIRLDYLSKRVKENNDSIIDILLALIAEEKVNGVIDLQNNCLELIPPQEQYYQMQLQNLRDLTERAWMIGKIR